MPYVVVEENYGGQYVVGKPGGEDVYQSLTAARQARDGYEQTAEEAGQPVGFRVYELREVR